MSCPIKKEVINKIKAKREEEKERHMKKFSDVIKETVKESQIKTTPTQLVLGNEHSHGITTCTIHAHFVNLGKPGTHATELIKCFLPMDCLR